MKTRKEILRVALPTLAIIIAVSNNARCARHGRWASSAARQYVSRQGGCPAKKLRVRGLVAANLSTPKSALWCANSNAARDSESVNDSGTTQYPSSSTEDGHGDKGGRETIHTHLSKSARVIQ